jgi:Deoxynucleoside kinases
MTKIINIEGNIGSGKSTLISKLKECLPADIYIFVPEPVNIWTSITDTNGENILQKFYKDQEHYAFPFQMMAYISRLHIIRQTIKNNPNKILIVERSCFTDRYVFAKMLYDTGKIEQICYTIYLMWFAEFFDGIEFMKTIFVNTAPQICLERIKKRNRCGENNIDLLYLEKCHQYHVDWLCESNVVKLELDGNHEFETEHDILNIYVQQIVDFIR